MATIKKMGAPTMKTKGSIGDIYQDLKSGKTYVCKSAYRDSAGTEDYTWQLMPAADTKSKHEPKVSAPTPAPAPVVEEPAVEEIKEEQPTQVEEETPVVEQKPERPRHNYNKQYNKFNRN